MRMKCKNKPIVIDAIQWNGKNIDEIINFIGNSLSYFTWFCNEITENIELSIATVEGHMKANIGDYIIKSGNGEFCSCKHSIFEQTYEMVGDGNETPNN